MGHFFSRHKSKVTEHDKAMLQLKQQRDELKRFQRRTNQSIDRVTATIKELLQQNQKSKALLLLKKKKCEENLLVQSEAYLTTVEGLINDVEFAHVQIQVLDGLKKGNKVLKDLNSLMKLEEVEKIMSDAQEAQEYQKELTSLLSGALSPQDDIEVEEELEKLLAEDVTNDLPDLPEHDVPKVKEKPSREKVSEKPHHDHHGDRQGNEVKKERVAVEVS